MVAFALLLATAGCAKRPPSAREEFLGYRETVIRAVHMHWSTAFRGMNLAASVLFRIEPDGTLEDGEVVRPSGNTAFDVAALRAVADTARVPPPPERFTNEFRKFLMEFRSD